MQSYPLNLGAGAAQTYTTAARRFVYESGKTVPEGADARIIVKPDNGNEITLRPGQSVGLDPGVIAATWFVRGLDSSKPIVGTVIIGSGEFEDSSLKFDSTSGAINVVPAVPFQIGNTAANRVPVALDPATEKALKEYPIMSYTHSRKAMLRLANGFITPGVLVSALENVRGVIVEDASMLTDGQVVRLIAKETAPVNPDDGEILIAGVKGQSAGATAPVKRIMVQPGKAIWATAPSAQVDVTGLFTIL